MAIGLGVEAIQKGYHMSYISMGALVPLLKTEDYLRKFQLQMKKSETLIWLLLMTWCIGHGSEWSQSFFHLVNHLYERSDVILTTNKGPKERRELLGDLGITTAILDRLPHSSEVLHLDGDSYRIKHRETLF